MPIINASGNEELAWIVVQWCSGGSVMDNLEQ